MLIVIILFVHMMSVIILFVNMLSVIIMYVNMLFIIILFVNSIAMLNVNMQRLVCQYADCHCVSDMTLFFKMLCIVKRVSWFKSSLLLSIKTVDITNINS